MTTGLALAVLTVMMNNYKRHSESFDIELTQDTWEPTGEPEELKDTLPILLEEGLMQMHMHPNFLQPTLLPIVGEKKLLLHFGCPCTLPCCKCDV